MALTNYLLRQDVVVRRVAVGRKVAAVIRVEVVPEAARIPVEAIPAVVDTFRLLTETRAADSVVVVQFTHRRRTDHVWGVSVRETAEVAQSQERITHRRSVVLR